MLAATQTATDPEGPMMAIEALLAAFETPYFAEKSPMREAYEGGILAALQPSKPVPKRRKGQKIQGRTFRTLKATQPSGK